MDEQLKQYLLEKAQQEYDSRKVDQSAGLMSGFGQVLQGRPVDLDWVDKRNKLAYDETLGRLKLEQSDAEKQAEQKRQFDVEQEYKNRALGENIEARKETARILAGQRAEERKFKKQERDDALKTKQEMKAAEEQKKVDESSYRYNILNQNLNKLSDIVNESGTFELFGDEGTKMDSLIYQTAVDYAKLVDPDSVAREGEVAAAQKYMLPIRQNMGLGTRNKTAQSLIEDYKKSLDERMNARQAAKGAATRPFESKPAFPRQIKKGNQIATVQNEQELKEAQSEGWQ